MYDRRKSKMYIRDKVPIGPLNHLEDYYLYMIVIKCYLYVMWRDGMLGAYFCLEIRLVSVNFSSFEEHY